MQAAFPQVALDMAQSLGQHKIGCPAEHTPALIEHLKLNCEFDFLVDLTAVDYPERTARFDLVYFLYSFSRNERIRVHTSVAEHALTITNIFAGANWLEREVFDMFGLVFEGHPDLKRILLPEDWEGHPLRKEYPIAQPDEAWIAANLEML